MFALSWISISILIAVAIVLTIYTYSTLVKVKNNKKYFFLVIASYCFTMAIYAIFIYIAANPGIFG